MPAWAVSCVSWEPSGSLASGKEGKEASFGAGCTEISAFFSTESSSAKVLRSCSRRPLSIRAGGTRAPALLSNWWLACMVAAVREQMVHARFRRETPAV
eukprot:scaffold596_cov236-Pinguiococcus_pyrenoidosus.AAC.16